MVPCGRSDGLPISMMLVGKHFDEMTIYKVAHAFEQAGDWEKCKIKYLLLEVIRIANQTTRKYPQN